jgi:hypothetical protein
VKDGVFLWNEGLSFFAGLTGLTVLMNDNDSSDLTGLCSGLLLGFDCWGGCLTYLYVRRVHDGVRFMRIWLVSKVCVSLRMRFLLAERPTNREASRQNLL